MIEFEKELKEAIEDYRQMRHADGVKRGPDWKGYQVYMAVWKGKAPCLGLPYMLFASEDLGEIRISEENESLEYQIVLKEKRKSENT